MTSEKAVDEMHYKGYSHTASSGNGNVLFFNKTIDNIYVGAEVHLETEKVNLSTVQLKYSCTIASGFYDIFNKKFGEFEKAIYLYTKFALMVDVLKQPEDELKTLIDQLNAEDEPKESKPDKPVPKTLEERRTEFRNNVIAKGKDKEYSKEMCKAFFDYWSETNEGGKKMRWEIAKNKGGVFNIGGRLATWDSKDQVYDAKFKNNKEKTADKQNQEVKTTKTIVDKTKLF